MPVEESSRTRASSECAVDTSRGGRTRTKSTTILGCCVHDVFFWFDIRWPYSPASLACAHGPRATATRSCKLYGFICGSALSISLVSYVPSSYFHSPQHTDTQCGMALSVSRALCADSCERNKCCATAALLEINTLALSLSTVPSTPKRQGAIKLCPLP